MKFFTGMHQPCDLHRVASAFVSVNRLRRYKKPVLMQDIIMDSGAFTELLNYGEYRHDVEEYGAEVMRWKQMIGSKLLAAVSQDYMCEPFILGKTGKTVLEHQRLTIQRYDRLLRCTEGVTIIPVLQGYAPAEYVTHIAMYGDRLSHGAWVGVGSVCKRNGDPEAIEEVLWAIKYERPDLKLHGFGLKMTALRSSLVRSLLHTADSMAWSFSARKQGRNANSWKEALAWGDKIRELPGVI
jgi:hypothetical protein